MFFISLCKFWFYLATLYESILIYAFLRDSKSLGFTRVIERKKIVIGKGPKIFQVVVYWKWATCQLVVNKFLYPVQHYSRPYSVNKILDLV